MRFVLAIVSLFTATFFLFSVVTPDPQDYQSAAGFSTFIDDDDIALCSVFTFVVESHHLTGPLLPLLEQACPTPLPYISTGPCRAPPSRHTTRA